MNTVSDPQPVVNPPQKIIFPLPGGQQFVLRVFPLRARGKEPALYSWKEYQTKSPTRYQLETWGSKFPGANYAVVGGQPIGKRFLVILDCDDHDQIAWVRRVIGPTYSVKTGRGFHFYVLTNSRVPSGHIGPGVRVSSVGNYVVAPGGIHPSGSLYELHTDVPPAVVPDEVVSPLQLRQRTKQTAQKKRSLLDRIGWGKAPTSWDEIPEYATRSEYEHGVVCRLLRKRITKAAIRKYFKDHRDSFPKFAELFDRSAKQAYSWLKTTIRSAREYLAGHDKARTQYLKQMPTQLTGITRQATHDLWESLLMLFRKFGRLYGKTGVYVKAAKCILTDTASRAYGQLRELLASLGMVLTKISSPSLQKGYRRLGSTFLLEVPAKPEPEKKEPISPSSLLTYGEVVSASAGEASGGLGEGIAPVVEAGQTEIPPVPELLRLEPDVLPG